MRCWLFSIRVIDTYTYIHTYKKFKWSHRRNGRYTPGPLAGGQKDSSLNMHSQRGMNDTHRAARGDVASAAIPVSISATAAQWRSDQHTAADRVRADGERSLTDELTIERQGGAWPLVAGAAIPVSISATAAQWRTRQHTAVYTHSTRIRPMGIMNANVTAGVRVGGIATLFTAHTGIRTERALSGPLRRCSNSQPQAGQASVTLRHQTRWEAKPHPVIHRYKNLTLLLCGPRLASRPQHEGIEDNRAETMH